MSPLKTIPNVQQVSQNVNDGADTGGPFRGEVEPSGKSLGQLLIRLCLCFILSLIFSTPSFPSPLAFSSHCCY